MLFWTHLVCGVAAGLVILAMCVTGTLLAFQKQMLARAASGYHAAPAPGATRMPLAELMARAAASAHATAAAVTVPSDPAAPVAVAMDNRSAVHVDPYTGRVIGSDGKMRAFFGTVERVHRSLAFGKSMRDPRGTALTGASNLAFLFLLLSGLYLWFPRRLSAHALRAVMLFRGGARGRARDWNWHHVLGFWSAPVLLVLVVTATFMSYGWPQKTVAKMLGVPAQEGGERGEGRPGAAEGPGAPGQGGETRSARAGGAGEAARPGGHGRPGGEARPGGEPRPGEGGGPQTPPVMPRAGLDAIVRTAAAGVPGWSTVQVRLPRSATAPVTATVSVGSGTRPTQRTTVTVDAETGAAKKWQRYGDQDAARRVRSWVRPLHTGEAGGIAGQIVAALASLAGALLVWTGLSLGLHRLRARIRRGSRPAPIA